MNRYRWLLAALPVVALLGAVLMAGDAGYWRRWYAQTAGAGAETAAALVQPRLRVAGEAGELPRATPESERIAPEALLAAQEAARAGGVRALVVHRHGHRVLEHFDAGAGSRLVAGGELSALPAALALGVLVDARRVDPEAAVAAFRADPAVGATANPWSRAARRKFHLRAPPALLLQDADGSIAETVSRRIWLPLRAADGWLWGRDDTQLRVDCCMVARLDDWMRVGDLLLGEGAYHGERLVSADWIRRLLAADAEGQRHPVWLPAQAPWQGDEPPAAREALWFDLGSDLRLWLLPRRGLSVLVWGGAPRDTLIPNIIVRGLLDQVPAAGAMDELNQMVPGH